MPKHVLVPASVFGILAVACGPTVALPGADAGSTTGRESTGAATVTGAGPTTSVPPVTTSPPVTTGADGPVTSDGIGFIEATCGFNGGGNPCDSWEQDCCRGDKCVPWANDGGSAWNALRCTAVAPDGGAPGEPCTVEGNGLSGIDDCDAGSYCWDVDPETNTGTCVALCTGGPEEPVCPEGQACVIANEGVIHFCFDRCDPVLQDCPSGQGCYPTETDFVCQGPSSSEAVPGTPCEYPWLCSPDYWCVEGAGYPGCAAPGCCSPFCDAVLPGGELPCQDLDPAMVCAPLYGPGEAPPGLEHVGVCRLP